MRAAARAIIIVGDQVLLMHRQKFGQEYYTLLGGGVSPGETLDQAVAREVMEESGYQVTKGRLVFIEKAGIPYGTQHIFLCEATGSEPRLWEQSEEAKVNVLGQNVHTPVLVPLKAFSSLPFKSDMLKEVLMYGFAHGFPAQPVEIDQPYVQELQRQDALASTVRVGTVPVITAPLSPPAPSKVLASASPHPQTSQPGVSL